MVLVAASVSLGIDWMGAVKLVPCGSACDGIGVLFRFAGTLIVELLIDVLFVKGTCPTGPLRQRLTIDSASAADLALVNSESCPVVTATISSSDMICLRITIVTSGPTVCRIVLRETTIGALTLR